MNAVYSRRLGDEPADRLLLANLAQWTLTEGRTPGRFEDLARHAGAAGSPAEVACRVAERALGRGRLLREQGSDSQLFYLATWTLWLADRFDRGEYWLDQALEDARERGSVLGYGIASASRAEVAYRRGDLALAEAHARAAADISPEDAAAVLVAILIEQGRLDEADHILARYRIPPDADHLLLQPIRAALGRLLIAQGRPHEASTELLACGKWLEAWPAMNPSYIAWRSGAALALNQAGEHERARQLAAKEVAIAEPLDQPRAHGIALRTLALIERTSDRIDLLQAAISELECSGAHLEHARALTDHGAALRRNGHRADARKPLREALDLAHRCRAPVLAGRARQELLATGARPRRVALTGRDALTPTEARVAKMAAQGRSTPGSPRRYSSAQRPSRRTSATATRSWTSTVVRTSHALSRTPRRCERHQAFGLRLTSWWRLGLKTTRSCGSAALVPRGSSDDQQEWSRADRQLVARSKARNAAAA